MPVVFEGAGIARLPAHFLNILVSLLRPLLHIDLSALIQITLDAPQNVLEHVIAEVTIQELVNMLLVDLATSEGQSCILDYVAHLLGQLMLHCVVNLEIHLFLLKLVLLHGSFLI